MHLIAGVSGKPGLDLIGLMRGVVIHDQVNGQVGRYLGIDLFEERQEFGTAVPLFQAADHFPGGYIQGGEQRRRAVALVVMGVGDRAPWGQGQAGLRSIQGLDLAFLIDAEHQRPARRIEIQPDDIVHLVDEGRIGGQLEGLCQMRFEAKGLLDTHHAGR